MGKWWSLQTCTCRHCVRRQFFLFIYPPPPPPHFHFLSLWSRKLWLTCYLRRCFSLLGKRSPASQARRVSRWCKSVVFSSFKRYGKWWCNRPLPPQPATFVQSKTKRMSVNLYLSNELARLLFLTPKGRASISIPRQLRVGGAGKQADMNAVWTASDLPLMSPLMSRWQNEVAITARVQSTAPNEAGWVSAPVIDTAGIES